MEAETLNPVEEVTPETDVEEVTPETDVEEVTETRIAVEAVAPKPDSCPRCGRTDCCYMQSL